MEDLKKSLTIGSALLASALVLGACGADNDKDATDPVDDPATNNQTEVETNTNETNDTTTGEQNEVASDILSYPKFEIEIEVDHKDAVKVEYDKQDLDDNEYVDVAQNIQLKDADAKASIEENLVDLQLPENGTNEEIVQAVVDYFNVTNYSKVEIELKDETGSKVKIKEKQ